MPSADLLEQLWRDTVREQLFGDSRPSRTPALILVGAQPGAGKTRGAIAAKALHPGEGFVDIIGDDLRAFHPDYDKLLDDPDPEVMPRETAATSAWMVERAIRYAAENGISALVEGTFRNPDTPLATVRLFDGFTRHAVALGVPRAVSWQGCVARHLAAALTGRPARWTPLRHHNLAYDAMIPTLEELEASALFDRLTAVDRDGQVRGDGERGWARAVEELRASPSPSLVEEFWRAQRWLAGVPREGLPDQVIEGLRALDDLCSPDSGFPQG
ncbi:MAG: zeta toxin family protein [Propionibacteriaceae bacterium]|jgi:hypothetical protein|nr:zeta toxin family protein [Propionibacteriaceae bacterium]